MGRGRTLLRAAAALAVALPVTLGAPALAASVTGAVQLKIIQPVSIVKMADLRFGSLVPGAAGGTVVIDADSGARSSSGGVTPVGGGYGAARFAATGEPDQKIGIKLPKKVTLTRAGGGATMTAKKFTRSGTPPNAARLDASGRLDFDIGATLSVGAGQASGLYTGTFDVEVNYQ